MKKRFLKIYIEITNSCNLNCSFCTPTKREKQFMQVDNFRKVAEIAKDYTDLVTLHVKGEPLLHPKLKEILEICEKNNLKVNITTNATLLSKNIDILKNSKSLRQLNISLHAADQNGINQEEYIFSIFESVDKIIENSSLIISYRLWNLENLEENSVNEFLLKKLGERYKVEDIVELSKNNLFVKLGENVFLNQDFEFTWPSLENEFISNVGKCQALKSQIAILCNGDVIPCCLDGDGILKLGNIFVEKMEDILNSDRATKMLEGFKKCSLKEELCQKCGYIKKFK